MLDAAVAAGVDWIDTAIGFSSSGPQQGEAMRRAMEIDVDGARHAAAADAVALAAVAQEPWADRVLLGAAGVGQLQANLRADTVELDQAGLGALAMDPENYWTYRSLLAWQ